jgi:hypothetical protein
MKRIIGTAFAAVLALGFAPQDDEKIFPEDWDTLDAVGKRSWEAGVNAATQELKDEAARRLEAAARALRRTVACGVEPKEAKLIVIEGMNCGYTDQDYNNLGLWVKAQTEKGLRGKALADAIHAEQARRGMGKPGGHEGRPGEGKGKPGASEDKGPPGKGKGKPEGRPGEDKGGKPDDVPKGKGKGKP